jgi:hypothetical protein
MGKILKILPIVAALLIVGAGAYVVWDMATARGRIEDWVGKQILGIANSYLEPQLNYDSFDYQAPRTIELGQVTFVAPDGTSLFEATRLAVTLAETPRPGKPIRIASLLLESPTLNIVRDSDGELVGFSQIVKPRQGETFKQREQQVEEQFRLSEVLKLEQVRLRGGRVRYVDGPDADPMVIDNLTSDLDISPTGDGPGWYTVGFDAGHTPGLAINVNGRMNLDTFEIVIDQGDLDLLLDEASLQSLPSQAQSLLREHDARGELTASLTGRAPLKSPAEMELGLTADLTGFSFAAGDYRIPIDNAELNLRVESGDVTASIQDATALDGSFSVDIQATLGAEGRAVVSTDALDLHALLRSKEGGPDLAGRLTMNARAKASLTNPFGTISGNGEVNVREGRLMAIPTISQIASLVDAATGGSGRSHKADVTFDLAPEGIKISELKLVTDVFAARGKGLIGYDASLDLAVNAGPMERLQMALGEVGKFLGQITDQIMTYNVRGRVGDPKISAQLGK